MEKPNAVEMIIRGLKEPITITKEDFEKYKNTLKLVEQGKKVGTITLSVGVFQFSAIIGIHYYYDWRRG